MSSVNFVKIVELLSIEQKIDKAYLHIKIYLDQELELFWEIDSSTSSSLLTICEFDEIHRYRLSLRTKLDASSNLYICNVTKTYLNNSNRLSFSCSEEFKNQLDLIKQCTGDSNLLQFPFLSKDLPSVPEEQDENTELDTTTIPNTKEQSKEGLVIFESEQKSNKIDKASNKDEHNEDQENVNTSIIENEITHDDNKAIESLLKVNPKKVTYKPGIWVTISSISLLIVILISFFILKPNQNAAQHHEKVEQKVVSQTSTIDTPSAELQNLLTLNELISFNLPKGYIGLTFNEGPSTYTEQILDILNQYEVGATFFFIGNQVAKYSNSVQSVYSNGYAIGSMTMTNTKMSTLPYEQQEKEIIASMESIKQITKEKVHLFRPPAALFNQDTQEILKKNDVKQILWNNNPYEVKKSDSTQLLDLIQSNKLSGSIIYLQETQEVVDALPAIIENAKKQNLKIVSIN